MLYGYGYGYVTGETSGISIGVIVGHLGDVPLNIVLFYCVYIVKCQ
jgi:hypothetical protein